MLFVAKTKDVIGDQETNMEMKCFASGLTCFSLQKCSRLNTYGKPQVIHLKLAAPLRSGNNCTNNLCVFFLQQLSPLHMI